VPFEKQKKAVSNSIFHTETKLLTAGREGRRARGAGRQRGVVTAASGAAPVHSPLQLSERARGAKREAEIETWRVSALGANAEKTRIISLAPAPSPSSLPHPTMDLFLAAPNRGGCPSVSDLTESEYSGHPNALFAYNAFNRSFRLKPYQQQRDLDGVYRHSHEQQDPDIMHDDAMSAISERGDSQPNGSQDEREILRSRRIDFFKGGERKEETGEILDETAAAAATVNIPLEEQEEVLSISSNPHEMVYNNDDHPTAVEKHRNSHKDYDDVKSHVFHVTPSLNLSFNTNHGDFGESNGKTLASQQNDAIGRLPSQDSLQSGPLVGFLAWRRQKSHSSSAILQKANSVTSMFHRKNENNDKYTNKSTIHHLPQVHEESFDQERETDVARQLAALKLEMAEVRTELDIAQQRYLMAEQERSHFRDSNIVLNQQNKAYQLDVSQLQQTKVEAETIIAKLKEECQYLTNERDRRLRDVSDFRTALEAVCSEATKLRTLLSSTQSSLQKETEEKNKLLEVVENQSKQISTQQIHLHEATEVLQLMREQAQKASIERANLLKKLTLAQHDRDNLRTIAKDRNAEVDTMKQEIERLKKNPTSIRRTNVTERDETDSLNALAAASNTSPNSSTRSIGPIRVPAWVEDMLFPSKRKRFISKSQSEKPPARKPTERNKKLPTRGYSEAMIAKNSGRRESDISELDVDIACAQEDAPNLMNAKISSGENSTPKSLFSNPLIAKLLLHLPFFGTKHDVCKDSEGSKGTCAEPLNNSNKVKPASIERGKVLEASSDREGSSSKLDHATGHLDRKLRAQSREKDNDSDETYRKPASSKTPPTALAKTRGRLSSSSNLQNESDDESMDELRHIWASAKLKIDCESSEEE
jgi:hypothetical protein